MIYSSLVITDGSLDDAHSPRHTSVYRTMNAVQEFNCFVIRDTAIRINYSKFSTGLKGDLFSGAFTTVTVFNRVICSHQ